MRYPSTRKEETRESLIESSRGIAKKDGFGTTGVDAIMSAIGLTGGAFYGHFKSKDDLFAAIVEREMENSAEMLAGNAESPSDHVAKSLRSYLSMHHALHPETGCALTTLGPEIARSDPEVRAGAECSLKMLQRGWSDRLDGDSDKAWALLAQCVGAIVMARVVQSDRSRQEILAANRRWIAKVQGEP